MGAVAPLEQLQAAENDICQAQANGDSAAVLEAMRRHGPEIGWKNVAHVTFYGRTAEALTNGSGRGE